MKKHTVFDSLHRSLSDSSKGSVLPDEIRMEADTAYFRNAEAKLRTQFVYIRDTGPAAWGCRINLPGNCLFRRDNGTTWYYQEEPDSCFLTIVGNSITLLYVDDSDRLQYERYIARDMDEE